jgi:hypothetical protein
MTARCGCCPRRSLQLTATATGATAQSVQYCVSGNQVSFSAPSDAANPTSPALVLVATK